MNADDRLIYLIFTAQNKLRTYLNNAMTADGVKVTVAQSGILFLLKEKDGRSMTELSRILGIDNSTLSGLTDRLEKARLVERNANPTDRRSSHIYMTREGIEAAEAAKRVVRRVNEKIKEGFAPEEMEAFQKVLKTFFGRFP
jgi:MarR family transcriptional regulator, organic hydroperoxide resistance regulator